MPLPKKEKGGEAKKEIAHIADIKDDSDFNIDESMSTILQSVTMSSDEENDTASTYDWIADSASTSHVTNQRHLMSDFIPREENVTGFGGNEVQAQGRGTVTLLSQIGKNTYHIVLKNVCYVPTSGNNLLSTIRLD